MNFAANQTWSQKSKEVLLPDLIWCQHIDWALTGHIVMLNASRKHFDDKSLSPRSGHSESCLSLFRFWVMTKRAICFFSSIWLYPTTLNQLMEPGESILVPLVFCNNCNPSSGCPALASHQREGWLLAGRDASLLKETTSFSICHCFCREELLGENEQDTKGGKVFPLSWEHRNLHSHRDVMTFWCSVLEFETKITDVV